MRTRTGINSSTVGGLLGPVAPRMPGRSRPAVPSQSLASHSPASRQPRSALPSSQKTRPNKQCGSLQEHCLFGNPITYYLIAPSRPALIRARPSTHTAWAPSPNISPDIAPHREARPPSEQCPRRPCDHTHKPLLCVSSPLSHSAILGPRCVPARDNPSVQFHQRLHKYTATTRDTHADPSRHLHVLIRRRALRIRDPPVPHERVQLPVQLPRALLPRLLARCARRHARTPPSASPRDPSPPAAALPIHPHRITQSSAPPPDLARARGRAPEPTRRTRRPKAPAAAHILEESTHVNDCFACVSARPRRSMSGAFCIRCISVDGALADRT